MSKAKDKNGEDEIMEKKKSDNPFEDDSVIGDDLAIDPSIIEDTFSDDFSEYNDVDNF